MINTIGLPMKGVKKEVLLALIASVDKAAESKNLSLLYERCGVLLPYLKNLEIDALQSNTAIGFIDAVHCVEKWSKSIIGANTSIWAQHSANLVAAIVELSKEEVENQPAAVVKKFWSDKNYAILNENLGRGSFGRTLLIRDEDIGLIQVAKVYDPKDLEDENQKLRFYNFFKDEIRLLHNLNHRNIVRVYAAHLYSRSRTGIILMEYVNGKTIDKYIEEYNVETDDINDTFLQIIEAFAYLEQKGVLHRDVRPSNIMIDEDGTVKVIDFGCGKTQLKGDTRSDSLVSVINHGDVSRLPEENFDKEYDSRTDMFYVGEMLGRLIKGSKCEGEFRYGEELTKMSATSLVQRYPSFGELKNMLNEKPVLNSSPSDKQTYSAFVDSLLGIISSRRSTSEISVSEESILSGLDAIIEENFYEEVVRNTSHLISIFIKGGYRYYQRRSIDVEAVRNFREWFGRAPEKKKIIILKSLRARLETIEIVDPITEDSMPF